MQIRSALRFSPWPPPSQPWNTCSPSVGCVAACRPPVHLQWSDLDFPLVHDYDLWVSVFARATVRMVECSIRCHASAEAIAVHATEQQRVPYVKCSKSMCVVRCRA